MTRPQGKPEHIGGRLRKLREMAGLSARELDRLAERTEGHCNLIEVRPKANVGAATLADYARVLGVSLDWLVLGVGDPPRVEDVRAAVERARGGVQGTGTEG